MSKRVPENVVDHVGSLKRPPDLMQTWRDWEAGKAEFEQLRAIQDHAIRDVISMQEALGLPVVTDGEFRRGGWSRGFLSAVEGFEFRVAAQRLVAERLSALKMHDHGGGTRGPERDQCRAREHGEQQGPAAELSS